MKRPKLLNFNLTAMWTGLFLLIAITATAMRPLWSSAILVSGAAGLTTSILLIFEYAMAKRRLARRALDREELEAVYGKITQYYDGVIHTEHHGLLQRPLYEDFYERNRPTSPGRKRQVAMRMVVNLGWMLGPTGHLHIKLVQADLIRMATEMKSQGCRNWLIRLCLALQLYRSLASIGWGTIVRVLTKIAEASNLVRKILWRD